MIPRTQPFKVVSSMFAGAEAGAGAATDVINLIVFSVESIYLDVCVVVV